MSRTYAHWAGPVGTIAGAGIARPGPVLIGDENQDLYDAYNGLVDGEVLENALDELAADR